MCNYSISYFSSAHSIEAEGGYSVAIIEPNYGNGLIRMVILGLCGHEESILQDKERTR